MGEKKWWQDGQRRDVQQKTEYERWRNALPAEQVKNIYGSLPRL